jgi:mitochondrial fission protein ELM1
MTPALPPLWVLDDGRAGHLNQSLGLAEALGNPDPEVITLRPKVPNWLVNILPVDMAYHPLPPKLPEMAIAAGSRAGRVLADLKARKPGLFAVQILKPWMGKYGAYDAVIMPAHDNPPKKGNVCAITGALNRVTKDRLAAESQRWAKRLASCRAPRLAVMVGGTSKHGVVTEGAIRALARQMLALAKAHNMSLLVSTSRRTGEAHAALLAKLLEEQRDVPVHVWRPEDTTQRDNPYFAYLALADAVVVTAESVSMVGEAATAGKPVYVWGDIGRLPAKFRDYLKTLEEQGRARPLPENGQKLTLRAPAAGLMDTLMAAGFVRARLRAKGKL